MTPLKLSNSGNIPSNVDWISIGWISAYRYRGLAHSGWAFSTIKSIEAHIYNKTGILMTLLFLQVFFVVAHLPFEEFLFKIQLRYS